MSAIPEDITDKANEISHNCGLVYRSSDGDFYVSVVEWATVTEEVTELSDAIARAILAERQRCADVAEGFRRAHDTGSGFDSQPARATAEAIRDAILDSGRAA